MEIYLYAHSGSGNHGCEALVRSTAAMLDRKPILFTAGYREDAFYNLDAVAQLREDAVNVIPRKSIRYALSAAQIKLTGQSTVHTGFARSTFLHQVRRGDICLSIGGDNYCYGGTDVLGNLNLLLKKRGAKTVLWGCSIDPEVLTADIVRDLKHYDLITVRESLTETALRLAGITQNVKAVADPAFLLEPEETPLPEGFVPGNTVGLNLSPLILNYTDHAESAMEAFHALIAHILASTNRTIALIPHVRKETGADEEVLRPIWEKYRHTGRVILVPDHNCMQLKYVISQCSLFVGARTHSTIAAYSSFVPTLVIGYSVKSRGIAADLFGTEENYVLPIWKLRQSEQLIRAYDWLEANAGQIRGHLKTVIPGIREKALSGKMYLERLMNDEEAE